MIAILCIIILIESSCIAWLLIKCKAENESRWDEISRAATYEHDMERLEDSLKQLETTYDKTTDFYRSVWHKSLLEQNELQLKLAKLLCPTNNHVWEEKRKGSGVYKCKKCGSVSWREVEDTDV